MRDIIFQCLVFRTLINAFKHVNISTLFWWRVICFLWEKLLTHTWITKINWHVSFQISFSQIWLFTIFIHGCRFVWFSMTCIYTDAFSYCWFLLQKHIIVHIPMTYFSKWYLYGITIQRVIFDFVMLLLLIFENGFHTKTI